MLIKFLNGSEKEIALLSGANLRGADLTGANLTGANLRGANLAGANLRGANLRGTNLAGANLRGADLAGANLAGANLRGADLAGANLAGAGLTGADLAGANLAGAGLTGADLSSAKTDEKTRFPAFQIPQTGQLTVWKKLQAGLIAELLIGRCARRTASLVGRKCRAEYVKVLSITTPAGQSALTGNAPYDDTVYAVGEVVRPDSYDPDPKVECTHGIHFFLTRAEAEQY